MRARRRCRAGELGQFAPGSAATNGQNTFAPGEATVLRASPGKAVPPSPTVGPGVAPSASASRTSLPVVGLVALAGVALAFEWRRIRRGF